MPPQVHTNKLAASSPSFSLTLCCQETSLVSLVVSSCLRSVGEGRLGLLCLGAALELEGAGVAGWVLLEKKRGDSPGGKAGDAYLRSSVPVALILSRLLHVTLRHSRGISYPYGKTPKGEALLYSGSIWMLTAFHGHKFCLITCSAAQRSNTGMRRRTKACLVLAVKCLVMPLLYGAKLRFGDLCRTWLFVTEVLVKSSSEM